MRLHFGKQKVSLSRLAFFVINLYSPLCVYPRYLRAIYFPLIALIFAVKNATCDHASLLCVYRRYLWAIYLPLIALIFADGQNVLLPVKHFSSQFFKMFHQ
jgi:hypothetical protein